MTTFISYRHLRAVWQDASVVHDGDRVERVASSAQVAEDEGVDPLHGSAGAIERNTFAQTSGTASFDHTTRSRRPDALNDARIGAMSVTVNDTFALADVQMLLGRMPRTRPAVNRHDTFIDRKMRVNTGHSSVGYVGGAAFTSFCQLHTRSQH